MIGSARKSNAIRKDKLKCFLSVACSMLTGEIPVVLWRWLAGSDYNDHYQAGINELPLMENLVDI